MDMSLIVETLSGLAFLAVMVFIALAVFWYMERKL